MEIIQKGKTMRFRGYAGTVLRVDLTKNKIFKENLNETLVGMYVGGRGIGASLLFDEVSAGIDPFSPDNKLIVMTGPLTGTRTPFTSKYVVVTKSPLTGGFARSVSGGHFGPELKLAGYDGLVIQGAAEKPTYISIEDDIVEIKHADHLWGRGTRETEDSIKEELGDPSIRVACIGLGGERLVRVACIVNDLWRVAGRCGCGAVMGSKNLKAIAVRGSSSVTIADSDEYEKTLEQALESIKSDSSAKSRSLWGTPETLEVANFHGFLPTRNFQTGCFESLDKIDAQAMREKMVVHDESCYACPLTCAKICIIRDGCYDGTLTAGPQFESLAMLGSDCGNANLESIVIANMLCNDLGIDAISVGNIIGFAMECWEKGLIVKKETNGIDLRWGNSEAIVKLVEQIGKREGIGNILAEGVLRASETIGKGSEYFAMHVKGLEAAAYDPRGLWSMALSYATSNAGAHASYGTPWRADVLDQKGRFSVKGKAAIVKAQQDTYALFETGIFCSFSRYGLNMDYYSRFLSAVTGLDLSKERLAEIGERIYNLERIFNVREGFTRKMDTLPRRFLEEPIPTGPCKGIVVANLNEMLDDYYVLRGWTVEGLPTTKTLKRLGLEARKINVKSG